MDLKVYEYLFIYECVQLVYILITQLVHILNDWHRVYMCI